MWGGGGDENPRIQTDKLRIASYVRTLKYTNNIPLGKYEQPPIGAGKPKHLRTPRSPVHSREAEIPCYRPSRTNRG